MFRTLDRRFLGHGTERRDLEFKIPRDPGLKKKKVREAAAAKQTPHTHQRRQDFILMCTLTLQFPKQETFIIFNKIGTLLSTL